MEALATKTHKKFIIQKQKHDKKQGVEESPVSIIQGAVDEMEIQVKSLIIEIEKDEDAYKVVAQTKVERKLKSGVSGELARKYEADMEACKRKATVNIEAIKNKITSLESKKEAFIADIDAKIQKLENDITTMEAKEEISLRYLQPLFDKCYQEIPLDVAYPPSYFKKKEEIKHFQRSIENQKNLVLQMKIAQYEETPKLDKEEEEWIKKREKSRREAIQREKEEKETEEFQRQEAIKVIQKEREARERADDIRRETQKKFLISHRKETPGVISEILKNLELEGLLED